VQEISQVAVKMKIARIDRRGAFYLRFTEKAIGLMSQISNQTIGIRIKGRDNIRISFWVDGIYDGVIKIIIEVPKLEGPQPEDNEELEVYTTSDLMYMEGSRNLTLKTGEVTQTQLPKMIPKGTSLIG
jgi:hypothetical protein